MLTKPTKVRKFFHLIITTISLLSFLSTNFLPAGITAIRVESKDTLASTSLVKEALQTMKAVHTGTAYHCGLVERGLTSVASFGKRLPEVLQLSQRAHQANTGQELASVKDITQKEAEPYFKTLIFTDKSGGIACYSFTPNGYFYRFTSSKRVRDPFIRIIERYLPTRLPQVSVEISGDTYYQEIIKLQPQFTDLVNTCLEEIYSEKPVELIVPLSEVQKKEEEQLNIGVVGLGRMGLGVAGRVIDNLADGARVFGTDLNAEFRDNLTERGGTAVESVEEMIQQMGAGRKIIMLYVPAGEIVDNVIEQVKPLLNEGDIIIDGGNSFWRDSQRRAGQLKEDRLHYLDMGTSGGIEGAAQGYPLMIGGEEEVFRYCEPALQAIATEGGYGYMGPSGAGHFVKMVHNAIEYIMEAAIGEGLELLTKCVFGFDIDDLIKMTGVWSNGSIIESRLVRWVYEGLKQPGLFERIGSDIGGGSTGTWTEMAAADFASPRELIATVLSQRLSSHVAKDSFRDRIVALQRYMFGLHPFEERPAEFRTEPKQPEEEQPEVESGEQLSIGVVGLGRMGLGVAGRVIDNLADGAKVFGTDLNPEFRDNLTERGGRAVESLPEMIQQMGPGRKIIMLYVPAGEIVNNVIKQVKPLLNEGDIIIDGGNSFWEDSRDRAEALREDGLHYLDVGTSGGIEGAVQGYPLMVGGEEEIFRYCEPALRAIATAGGYGYMGPSGAGHFVKMVHNAIEYIMEAAIGEGIELLTKSVFGFDVDDLIRITGVWANGSIIQSRLVSWVHEGLKKPGLFDCIGSDIGGGSTGTWTEKAAMDFGSPRELIAIVLSQRLASHVMQDSFRDRIVALQRYMFGLHPFEERPAAVKGSHLVREAASEVEEEVITIAVQDSKLVIAQEADGHDKSRAELSAVLKQLVHIYGLGITARVKHIQLVRNLGGAGLYPEGRSPLASYRNGLLKIDLECFNDRCKVEVAEDRLLNIVLFEELEHELLESIGDIVPECNTIMADVVATLKNVRRFLDPNQGVTDEKYRLDPEKYRQAMLSVLRGDNAIDPDGEYFKLLNRLNILQEQGQLDDEAIIYAVISYLCKSKLYEKVRDELGMPEELARTLNNMDLAIDDVLSVLKTVNVLKRYAELMREIQEAERAADELVDTFRSVKTRRVDLEEQRQPNKAVRMREAGKLQIVEEEIPECSERGLVVKIIYAGICGTDFQMYSGERPHNPGILGHECVARIVAVGKQVAGFSMGDIITINPNNPSDQDDIIGHTEENEGLYRRYYHVAHELIERKQIVKVPQNFSLLAASILEPLACAIHGQRIIKDKIKDKEVFIIGAGPSGLLQVILARHYGARKVYLINKTWPRLQQAIEKGIIVPEEAILSADFVEMERKVAEVTNDAGMDIVILNISFHNVMETLDKIVDVTADNGVIHLWGGYTEGDIYRPDEQTAIDCWKIRRSMGGEWIRTKGKNIYWAGTRGASYDNFIEAIELIDQGLIDPRMLVSHVVSLASVPAVFEEIDRTTCLAGKRPGKLVVDVGLDGECQADIQDSVESLEFLFDRGEFDFFFSFPLLAAYLDDISMDRARRYFHKLDLKAQEVGIERLNVQERYVYFRLLVAGGDDFIAQAKGLNSGMREKLRVLIRENDLTIATAGSAVFEVLIAEGRFAYLRKGRLKDAPKVLLVNAHRPSYAKDPDKHYVGNKFVRFQQKASAITASYLALFGIEADIFDLSFGESELQRLKDCIDQNTYFISVKINNPVKEADIDILYWLDKVLAEKFRDKQKPFLVAGGISARENRENLLRKTPLQIIFGTYSENSLVDMCLSVKAAAGRQTTEQFGHVQNLYLKTDEGLRATKKVSVTSRSRTRMNVSFAGFDWKYLELPRYWQTLPGGNVHPQNEHFAQRMVFFFTAHGDICPRQCEFCSYPHFTSHPMRISPESAVEMLASAYRAYPEIQLVNAQDGDILLNEKWAREFVRIWKERYPQIKLKWYVNTHVTTCRDTEYLQFLKREFGVEILSFGQEAASKEVLVQMGKIRRRKVDEEYPLYTEVPLAACKEGIPLVRTSWILFYPSLTQQQLLESIEKMTELIAEGVSVALSAYVLPRRPSRVVVEEKYPLLTREYPLPDNNGKYTIEKLIVPQDPVIKRTAEKSVRSADAVLNELLDRYGWDELAEYGWRRSEAEIPANLEALALFIATLMNLREDSDMECEVELVAAEIRQIETVFRKECEKAKQQVIELVHERAIPVSVERKPNQALRMKKAGELECEDVPIPYCWDDGLVVKILYSGICGTDFQIYRGERPYNPGIAGHECVVEIIAVGRQVEGFRVGDLVTVNPNNPHDQDDLIGHKQDYEGFHQRYYRIDGDLIARGQVFRLPADISLLSASLIEPLACAVSGQEKVKEQVAGKNVFVFGAGPAGLMQVMLSRVYGAKSVHLVNRSLPRLEQAVARGFVSEEETMVFADLEEEVATATAGHGMDVVILATSYIDNLRETLDRIVGAMADKGTILLWGGIPQGFKYKPDGETEIDCYKIRRGCAGRWIPSQGKDILWTGVRGAKESDFARAVELVREGTLDLSPLVTHVLPINAVPRVFAEVNETGELAGQRPLKMVINPWLEDEAPIIELQDELSYIGYLFNAGVFNASFSFQVLNEFLYSLAATEARQYWEMFEEIVSSRGLESLSAQEQYIYLMLGKLANGEVVDAQQLQMWETNMVVGGFSTERSEPSSFINRAVELLETGEHVLKLGEGPTVLDLEPLQEKQCTVVATDTSPTAVAMLQQEIAEKGLEGVSAQVQDINDTFRFADDLFSAVLSRLCLLRYTGDEEIRKTLREIKRVLRPGGKLILQVKSAEDYRYGKGKKLAKDVFVLPDKRVGLDHVRHFWREESLKRILQEEGFVVSALEYSEERLYLADEQPSSLITVIAHSTLYSKYTSAVQQRGNNFVVLPPSSPGEPLTHTTGHYHPGVRVELHQVLRGRAIYALQELKDGVPGEVRLVEVKAGEKVIIPPNFVHLTINPSPTEELVISNHYTDEDEFVYDIDIKREYRLEEITAAEILTPQQFFAGQVEGRTISAEERDRYEYLREHFGLAEEDLPPAAGWVTKHKACAAEVAFEVVSPREIRYQVINTQDLFSADNLTLAQCCVVDGVLRKVLVVVDSAVYAVDSYREMIEEYFRVQKIEATLISLEPSEEIKHMDTALGIVKQVQQLGLGRRDVIIGIGGGIVTDIAGFAAQLSDRGIGYIKVPTTLLGLIDAGIGIKTGVNFGEKKNYVGSFYPPIACLNDLSFLQTLDDRQIRCGLAEIVKMAIMSDRELFELLEQKQEELRAEKFQGVNGAHRVIELAIERMLEELAPNLFEKILRRIPDFGHTFSPALEIESGHELLHGEAVAIDMAITTMIAYYSGMCSEDDMNRIINVIIDMGLAVYHPVCDPDMLWARVDDVIKHRGGNLNLPIPVGIGQAEFLDEFCPENLRKAIKYLKERQRERGIDKQPQLAVKMPNYGRLEVVEEQIPECGEEELLIRIVYAGICGTDFQMYRHERPYKPEVLGHECVAQVIKVGSQVTGYEVGELITFNPNNPQDQDDVIGHKEGRGGFHQRYFRVSKELMARGQVIKVPAEVSTLAAGIVEPLSCVVRGQQIIKERIAGKKVLVLGAGPAGLLHVQLARAYEAQRVVLANRSKERLEQAVEMGIVAAEDTYTTDDLTGMDFDVVIIAISYSNVVQTIDQMVDLLAEQGTILLFGGIKSGHIYQPDEDTRIDCFAIKASMIGREIEVKGKNIFWAGSRGATRESFLDAVRLVREGKIDPRKLITHIVSLASVPEVFREVSETGFLAGVRPCKMVIDTSVDGKMVREYQKTAGSDQPGSLPPKQEPQEEGIIESLFVPAGQLGEKAVEIPVHSADLLPHIIAFDVGGTTTRVGVISPAGEIIGEVDRFATPTMKIHAGLPVEELQELLLDRICESVRRLEEMLPGMRFSQLAFSFAAPVTKDGVIVKAASLWGEAENYPLKERLAERLPGRECFIANDVVAASWRYGLRPEYQGKKICLLTISTGIGHKIFDASSPNVDDDKVISLGHLRIDTSADALTCACGEKGHLAAYASGQAAENRLRMKAAADPEGFQASALSAMAPAAELNNEHFAAAVNSGDEFALALLAELTAPMAQELVRIAQTDVDKIVIMGGFVLAIKEAYFESLLKQMLELGLYGKDEAYIRSLFAWAEDDDNDGVFGVAQMLRYQLVEEESTVGEKAADTIEYSQVLTLKESIISRLQKNRERKGGTLTIAERDMLEQAWQLAYNAHNVLPATPQLHHSGEWFIYHPLQVAQYLVENLSVDDVELIAATFVHDVIEHTDMTAEDVASLLGQNVCNIALDLSQNSKIQQMDIEQLQELGFQVERIATLLGIDDLAAPDAVERIAKMALKIEHYYRLMNNPLDPRSRLLKVVDNIVNYSSVDLLPPAQVRKREPLELQLFRSYCETVRMPERVSRDIIEYIGKLVDLFNPASSAINEITESI